MGKFSLWLATFLVIVGLFLRAVALRPYVITVDDEDISGSLAPSLVAGDRVLLWRLTTPVVGDLVVCRDPEDKDFDVIGRLMGEGRDTLMFRGPNVTINGALMGTESACKDAAVIVKHPTSGAEVVARCSIEVIGGITHKRASASGDDTYFQEDEESIYEVSARSQFLVSDNRVFPYDSRRYGEIDQGDCPESVFLRLWSAKGWGDVENRLTFIK